MLLLVTVIKIFAGLEASLAGVFGDVAPKVLVLFHTANEVIERLLLPELAFLSGRPIDLPRGVVQPRIALLLHPLNGAECGEQMHVRGHDDEISHAIPIGVEVQERVGHGPRKFRPSEKATTEARVKEILTTAIEPPVKAGTVLLVQRRDDDGPMLCGVVPVKCQPVLFLAFPLLEHRSWNRIACAKRDEDDGSRLRPMRPEMLVDE